MVLSCDREGGKPVPECEGVVGLEMGSGFLSEEHAGNRSGGESNNLGKAPRDAEVVCVSKHGEGSRLELWFHAACSRGSGGARSWIWAAVSLSITCIGPPHMGQIQRVSARTGRGASGLTGFDSCTESSKRAQSGSNRARRRLARRPKLRMRTTPRGSRWSRKRRRNSSTGSVIRRFLFLCAESLQRKVTWPSAKETSR